MINSIQFAGNFVQSAWTANCYVIHSLDHLHGASTVRRQKKVTAMAISEDIGFGAIEVLHMKMSGKGLVVNLSLAYQLDFQSQMTFFENLNSAECVFREATISNEFSSSPIKKSMICVWSSNFKQYSFGLDESFSTVSSQHQQMSNW